jgi:hypothetical protein
MISISKTIAAAACLCLFAACFSLIAFARSESSGCRRASTGKSVPPIMQTDDPASLSAPEQFKPVEDACSDSIAGCTDPVKHLGTQNGCACFACGYGTASQHSICTRDAKDKDSLFKRAR